MPSLVLDDVHYGASQVVLVVKNLPPNAGYMGLIPALILATGVTTHSGILAWEIQWTKEPGRL